MFFSTFRAGVKIDWQTSKRLKAGSLLALSPTSDKFQKQITIAVVGARTMEQLNESESVKYTVCKRNAMLISTRPAQG